MNRTEWTHPTENHHLYGEFYARSIHPEHWNNIPVGQKRDPYIHDRLHKKPGSIFPCKNPMNKKNNMTHLHMSCLFVMFFTKPKKQWPRERALQVLFGQEWLVGALGRPCPYRWKGGHAGDIMYQKETVSPWLFLGGTLARNAETSYNIHFVYQN